jgi:hypothetical protein
VPIDAGSDWNYLVHVPARATDLYDRCTSPPHLTEWSTTQKSGYSKQFVANLTCVLLAEIMRKGPSGVFASSAGFVQSRNRTYQTNKEEAVKGAGHVS